MARLTDVPKEHRDVASRFKHLERMPAEEARHRAAHIHHLENRCPLTGDLREITLAHTSRLAESLPVGEYLAQLRHLNEMTDQMPATGIDSPRYDFLRAADQLRAANTYPPGFVRACEEWMQGRREPAMYPDCNIGAVVGAKDGTQ